MIRIRQTYQFTQSEKTLLLRYPCSVAKDWNRKCFKRIKDNIRCHLLREQNRVCPYCGIKLPRGIFYVHIDHIAPKQNHVRFIFEPRNLAVTCQRCNTSKGKKETMINPNTVVYPSSGQSFLIIHPHFDDYFNHIEIVYDIFLKAKTLKGEKTIQICNLYRTGIAEDRGDQLNINRQEYPKKWILQLAKENDNTIKQQIIDFIEQSNE